MVLAWSRSQFRSTTITQRRTEIRWSLQKQRTAELLTSPPIVPLHLFIDLLNGFLTGTWSWSITFSVEDKNEWSYTSTPQCAFTTWARTFFLFIFGGVLTDIDRYWQVFSRQFDSLMCHGGIAERRKLRENSASVPTTWDVQRGWSRCTPSNEPQENTTGNGCYHTRIHTEC
jgi:hypothetical protein